jgi:flagellar biosynthesis activator protein FlaF
MSPGKPNQPHNNPYAAAAGAYGTNAQKNASDPRETEARVLLKSAQFLLDAQNNWDDLPKDYLVETLKYNRDIWMMFYDTAVENTEGTRPKELRNNIYNLANFIFKREIDILAKPEKQKLDILISINRDIAAGLMEGMSKAPIAPAPNPDTKNPPEGGTNQSA